MSYLEKHQKACTKLSEKIDAYLDEMGVAETRFCKDAGAHVAALKRLREGTATPATYDQLERYYKSLIGDNSSVAAE